jgi:hypothetical protein
MIYGTRAEQKKWYSQNEGEWPYEAVPLIANLQTCITHYESGAWRRFFCVGAWPLTVWRLRLIRLLKLARASCSPTRCLD